MGEIARGGPAMASTGSQSGQHPERRAVWTEDPGSQPVPIETVSREIDARLARATERIRRLVVRGGFEPQAFRFSGAFAASLHVAGCGLMGQLAATTMAGCRLVWPDVCRRWLGGFQ